MPDGQMVDPLETSPIFGNSGGLRGGNLQVGVFGWKEFALVQDIQAGNEVPGRNPNTSTVTS